MLVVGIGGTMRADSSSAAALRHALDVVEGLGATTERFFGADLVMPPYDPGSDLSPNAMRLLESCRIADAIIIASPGYHGTVSGLVKNALDHLEELRTDVRPYLDGRLVGCIAVAFGWQAAVNTLGTLRDITHALRGIPTPLGVTINSAAPAGDDRMDRLTALAIQVVELTTALGAGTAIQAGPRG